ncbi:unnamed protein product [Chrysodeixis includens]|uniref:Par3/HAL N-terminal domain-containing protein n=1 Tax=Chrysodeixis includens TaxID=689277 RepID=A0A9N8PXC1_CHRIL|nr:unnamed protein product [Chrysodeixis includens]
MKVTVCFGSVRVLVPCGAGDLLVRDLVREATHRYKKATGQRDWHLAPHLVPLSGSVRPSRFATLFAPLTPGAAPHESSLNEQPGKHPGGNNFKDL